MRKQKYWYKLDNAGKVFPAVSKDSRSNIFRISFYLDEAVDPIILEQAVNETLPRFETFAVQIRTGLFWQYLGANTKIAKVYKETPFLCEHFKTYTNRNFLFKVFYLDNKISLETFHGISDGLGALQFLKSILFKYFKLLGFQMDHQNKILGELPYSKKESEDNFVSNYDKDNKLALREEKAYHIKSESFSNHFLLAVKLKFNTKELLTFVKTTYQATLTQFITALVAYSIYLESIDFVGHKKPIKVFVPVNLRPYFNSKTLRNFSLYLKCTYPAEKKTWTFEEILEVTKKDFVDQLDKDKLNSRISALVGLEKNLLIRMLPFALKNIAFKIGYNMLGESINTCSLSNIGLCDLPDDMKTKVIDMDFLSFTTGLSITTTSINDVTNIIFTTPHKDLSIINQFISFLTDHGVSITIDTNYKEAYDEIL